MAVMELSLGQVDPATISTAFSDLILGQEFAMDRAAVGGRSRRDWHSGCNAEGQGRDRFAKSVGELDLPQDTPRKMRKNQEESKHVDALGTGGFAQRILANPE